MGLFSGMGRQRGTKGRRSSLKRQQSGLRRGNLLVEGLEDRLVLSTLFIEPAGFPVDGSHFHTIQDALGAAKSGDDIKIEPGAVVSSVGNSTGSPSGTANLTAIAAPAATILVVNHYVAPGEVIQIGGATPETNLVLTAVPSSQANFTLTLKAPLASGHMVGDRIDTLGRLGIGVSVILEGDTLGAKATVLSPLEIWGPTSGVTLQTLTLASSLTLQPGVASTTIRNNVLGAVTQVGGSSGNGLNAIRENVITGAVTLTGNTTPGMLTQDQVLNNQFNGGTLSLTRDNSAKVQGNTFNDSGDATAITVRDSVNAVVANNTITIVNGGGLGLGGTSGPVGITVANVPSSTATLRVSLLNNIIDTNTRGRGILLNPSVGNGTNFQVLLQGNDLHFNVIGLEDSGDTTNGASSAGVIDAGGGAQGSLGGNNFRSFTPADAAAGTRFAIFLHGTLAPGGVISARNNVWSTANPVQVVKDGANNTAVGSPPLALGTGTADVGTAAQQLSADQQFVQAVYNDILGRSGGVDELNQWVGMLPAIGTTGVANDIIRSVEALTRLVDGLYVRFLNRPADQAGESAWVNLLVNGGIEEQVIAGLVGSDEYFDRLGNVNGSANEAYVQSLYQNLLERAGSNSEVAMWQGPLASMGRTAIAQIFAQSSEYRSTVVRQFYYDLLRRPTAPTSDEVAGWVNSAADILSIEPGFIGTTEFYLNG